MKQYILYGSQVWFSGPFKLLNRLQTTFFGKILALPPCVASTAIGLELGLPNIYTLICKAIINFKMHYLQHGCRVTYSGHLQKSAFVTALLSLVHF